MLITHKIAEVAFRTDSDAVIPHLLQDPYRVFRVQDERIDVVTRLRQYDPGEELLPRLEDEARARIMHTVGFPRQWVDRPELRRPLVAACLRECLAGPEMVYISLSTTRTIISDFARHQIHFFYDPVIEENITGPLGIAPFRNTLARFLPGFDAMLVHASGTVRPRGAALFLAPDEGGKTTVVRDQPLAAVLNDDQVALRQVGATIYAHSTPFGRLTGGPQRARLAGIFLLEKAERFELIPLRRPEVLEFIWREHLHRTLPLPRADRLQAFDLLTAACRQAVTYRLRVAPGQVDWDAIDAVLAR